MQRFISYADALREAISQEMERDSSVLIFGLGVDDPKSIMGTTKGLSQQFGPERVFDTPLSEDAMTGVAIGAALAGLRPIHVHIRMDFMLLAMNQLINMAAKMRFMYGGQFSLPIVVRSIIGKSWGQGGQHSQSLYSLFMNIPGLKVVAPTTPYAAKGCLAKAVRDDNPVVFVEHRLLYMQKGAVPEHSYTIEPSKACITHKGNDITLVGISWMQIECLRAQLHLEQAGISAEIIDPVWLAPLDMDTIVQSVRKTRKLCVVDNGWMTCGAGAEIIATVLERLQGELKVSVARMGFAPVPCPTTPCLENLFYPNAQTIASKAFDLVQGRPCGWIPDKMEYSENAEFKGPF